MWDRFASIRLEVRSGVRRCRPWTTDLEFEEAFQEVLLMLHRNGRGVVEVRDILAWTISATLKVIRWQKSDQRRSRRRGLSIVLFSELDQSDLNAAKATVGWSAPDWFVKAWAELNSRERDALLIRYVMAGTRDEQAVAYGATFSVLKRAARRGRRRLVEAAPRDFQQRTSRDDR